MARAQHSQATNRAKRSTQPIIDNVTEAVTGSPADGCHPDKGGSAELRQPDDQTFAGWRQLEGVADTGIEPEEDQEWRRIAR